MKKMLLLFALLLAAVPCYAGIPPLPFDGNGNMYPVMWDGTNWVFVSDSTAIGSAFGSTDSMPVKGSIYVITSAGAPLYVREVNNDTDIYVVNQDTHVFVVNQDTSVRLVNQDTSVRLTNQDTNVVLMNQDTNVFVVYPKITSTDTIVPTGSSQVMDLGDSSIWIYVTTDTDIYIDLTQPTNVGKGELLKEGSTMVYRFYSRYLYVSTKSGLDAAYPTCVRIRGNR